MIRDENGKDVTPRSLLEPCRWTRKKNEVFRGDGGGKKKKKKRKRRRRKAFSTRAKTRKARVTRTKTKKKTVEWKGMITISILFSTLTFPSFGKGRVRENRSASSWRLSNPQRADGDEEEEKDENKEETSSV